MRSERRYPEPDEARRLAEHDDWGEGDEEEESWQQPDDPDPDRPTLARLWWRAALLGVAIFALIVLLFQRLAEIG